MLLIDLVDAAGHVTATRSRRSKAARLAECLRRLAPEERAIGLAYLSGTLTQGRIRLGPSALRSVVDTPSHESRTLSLAETDATLDRIAAVAGSGSGAARRRLLAGLWARAGERERDFLGRLILGELRQGALEGVMIDAIAEAAELPVAAVRRAAMLSGDLAEVGTAALADGAAGLDRFRLQLFIPLQPMLAQPAADASEAIDTLGEAALEYKLDGVRVQVHRHDDEVRIYTRRLHEITDRVPELVETVRGYPARRLILDGEALAFRADGRPQPFQVSMRRLGRKLDVAAMRATLPLQAWYFDCLHLDGEDLIDRSAGERHRALSEVITTPARVPRSVTADRAEAEGFLARAIGAGHEGIMAKSLDAPYSAGSRGADWLKIKPAQTLDLVVLAAEWGSGRRRGRLSNLHLGARDPGSGGFVMLGKTFKGLTDKMLEWQTRRLLELELGREGHIVHVRPELVVEIAFNELQASPQYPGGLALRFARVKRYRTDKQADDADTMDTVRALYQE
jgi:DNA ligase-1